MEIDKKLTKLEPKFPNELGFVTFEDSNHIPQSRGISLKDFYANNNNPTVNTSEDIEVALILDVQTEPNSYSSSKIEEKSNYNLEISKNGEATIVKSEEQACSQICVKFECVVCDKTFETKKLLKAHFVSHRLQDILNINTEIDTNYVCVWCPKYFPSMEQFYNHLNSHSLREKFFCHVCNGKFYNQNDLNQHFDEHKERGDYQEILFHSQTPKNLLTSNDRSVLRSLIKNLGNQYIFYCNLCATIILERNDYHMKTCHKNYVESFRCHVCGAYFYLESDLRVHLSEYLKNGDNTTKVFSFIPEEGETSSRLDKIYSPVSSNSNSSFNMERNSPIMEEFLDDDQSNEERNNFYCQVCNDGIPYNDEKLYNKHFKSHKCECGHPDCVICKSKPLLYCSICEKHFSHERSLRCHLNRIHGSERQRTEKCNLCNKSFYAKCTLRDHLKTHYDSCNCGTCESCLKKNPKFQCGVCKRILLSESKLARHSLIHSGEKPWICEICAKSFSQKSNLKVHVRSHIMKAKQARDKVIVGNNDSLSF